MVVKKAIINGVCSRVSNVTSVTPCARTMVTAAATMSPPITGAGTLYRDSNGAMRRTRVPAEQDESGERDGVDEVERQHGI